MNDIIRSPTRDELEKPDMDGDVRGFIPLETPRGKTKSPFDKFLVKLHEEQAKAVKAGLPFAEAAVRADIEDIKNQFEKTWKRQGYVDSNYKFPKLDWSKYSDLKNFELVKEEEKHDEYLSKIHRLPVFVDTKTYVYKGFSNKYIVQEGGESAVQRALEKLEKRNLGKKDNSGEEEVKTGKNK